MAYPWTAYKTWTTGEVLTASDLNNSFTSVINNSIPANIDDYSTNSTVMGTTTDPYPAAVASLATSLSGELERLRYIITQITGKSAWYVDAAAIGSKGADVASANALTLGTDGNFFDITGTTAITSITTLGIGSVVRLQFDGALVLTHHNTDLILPGATNITTATGDVATLVEYAAGKWFLADYSGLLVHRGTQTITGAKTFSSAITITPVTNQLVLGVTNTTTISATAPAASRTYTMPDAGGAADFVLTAGNQTLGGTKTFSVAVKHADGTAAAPGVTFSVTDVGFYYSSAGDFIGVSIDGAYVWLFDAGTNYCKNNLLPDAAGTYNFGDASLYWNDVSYKTLTDRGCLPWCDEGVEMRDGTIVSDIDALCAIKKHPTKKTVHGLPMLDYESFPSKAYRQADKDGVLLPRDKNGVPYWTDRDGNIRQAADGIEMTMMFGVMIGAFKELNERIKKLENK